MEGLNGEVTRSNDGSLMTIQAVDSESPLD
jgi:hypothetical protein